MNLDIVKIESKIDINGVINVIKPAGMTSFDIVRRIRKIANTKKVGHIGTLDPIAVGVLPVCVGKATKIIEYLVEGSKTYCAEMTLGSSTDTQDSEGKTLKTSDVNCSDYEIKNAIMSFVGEYKQTPPMYSALKYKGKKLYEYARQGIEIERKTRDIYIHWIKIKNINNNKVVFDVNCSKGAYIRTLCDDIGKKLGCYGHMSFLLRIENGVFNLDNAHTLKEIEQSVNNGNTQNVLIGIDLCLKNMIKVELPDLDTSKFVNGVLIKIEKNDKPEILAVCKRQDSIIGFGRQVKREGNIYLKPIKIL